MRIVPYLCLSAAMLLLGSCAKDLSCYRDMIIGSWVEQSFDEQFVMTNLRDVYIFDRKNLVQILRIPEQDGRNRTIDTTAVHYEVYCKILSLFDFSAQQDYEVITFTDSTLRIRMTNNTIAYKKASSENANAKRIQNLWEMTHSSDPLVTPFRILFETNNTYRLFEYDNGDWEEKPDKAGAYAVFDTFLMTSGASCWDISFGGEEAEQYTSMNWQAVVSENGHAIQKTFDFTQPLPVEEDAEL
ncbi:MAG: hypothetical protein FWE99_01070 [Bacteroidales bacterium]|nr:hypothetical protein [Bacteroidales bacterium]